MLSPGSGRRSSGSARSKRGSCAGDVAGNAADVDAPSRVPSRPSSLASPERGRTHVGQRVFAPGVDILDVDQLKAGCQLLRLVLVEQ